MQTAELPMRGRVSSSLHAYDGREGSYLSLVCSVLCALHC